MLFAAETLGDAREATLSGAAPIQWLAGIAVVLAFVGLALRWMRKLGRQY